jgi:crotonobetainyl-CoA:carnitine CoA-transferase CaiB-like acyl-CoA transferase
MIADSTSPAQSTAALEGVRVLDLSRFIAGPLCGQILADMGADVVKVERPGGEDGRRHRPFVHSDQSVYTMVFNRNKHAITLDTRHARALELLRGLVRQSDVVIENYRPGTMAAMGLGFDEIRAINPRTTLVSLSGFGQTGPNRDRALFDAIAQAMTGLMSLTGRPDDEPTMTGTFVADYISAFHGAMGALVALHARERTGRGQHVDVAAFDALFSCLGTHPSAYAMLGEVSRRSGSRDQITVPADVYEAADGFVYIHAGTNALFPRLCTAMGRADLVTDTRFSDQGRRLEHAEEIDKVVSAWTSGLTCLGVEEALATAGVPCGKVASIPEVVDSPQVRARDMMIEAHHPELGPLRLPGMPIKLSDTPGRLRKAPPMVGEDTDAILAQRLGLSADDIAALRDEGAI